MATEYASEHGIHPIEQAAVHLTFRYRRRGRRDLDNTIAASKGLLDGLVGPLIPDDDYTHLVRLSASIEAPRSRDEVQVEVIPA